MATGWFVVVPMFSLVRFPAKSYPPPKSLQHGRPGTRAVQHRTEHLVPGVVAVAVCCGRAGIRLLRPIRDVAVGIVTVTETGQILPGGIQVLRFAAIARHSWCRASVSPHY